VVGTTDTQTLTNKTISGGSVTGATVTNTTIDYDNNTITNFPGDQVSSLMLMGG
jgi:hypothetical protein